MAFDRYKILTKHYENRILSWDWERIENQLFDYTPEGFDPKYDDALVGTWLGTTLGVFPSGKIYAPWTTNQTRSDVIRDECFSDALEKVASLKGFAVDYCDGDVFVVKPK